MKHTHVKDVMTRFPVFITPESSLQQAASMMRDKNIGILPVGDPDNALGIITDHDIIIRAIADGLDPFLELVGDHMTDEAYACAEADTLEHAAELMRHHQVSRLLVKNDADTVSGIVSFGCMLRKDHDAGEVAKIVARAVGN